MTNVHVIGQGGKERPLKTSDQGEALVRAFDYSDPVIKQLTDTTVTNLVGPKANEQYILTGMFASANRSVDANGAVLEIYESAAADSGTQTKLLFSIDMARQGNVSPPPVPGQVTIGQFVNADSTQTAGIITVTIWGYYIPIG